jgi:hypothetical protein
VTKTIENLFYFIDVFSVLLPISFFIVYWKASYSTIGLRILFFYSALHLTINFFQFLDPQNAFLYALFTIVESVAFASFLYVQVRNLNIKKATLVTGALLVLFNIIYPFFSDESKLIDSIPIGIETIVILVFSYYFLYEKTNDTSTLYIYSTFPFWVVIGMVLYLSGSLFIYLFASSISHEEAKRYWVLTNFLGFLKNVFFTIGIILNSKPPKRMPPSDFEFSTLN